MFKRLIKKQIHLLYANNLFLGIATSLFGIFVPIYFLTLGFSLQQVFIYYLIFQTTTFVAFTLSGKFLSRKIGYKPILFMGIISMAVFVILLSVLNLKEFPIYLIALVQGLNSAFYYLPLHAFFSRSTEKNSKGTQFGIYSIFGDIAGLFGPLVGAIIATKFSFQYLFIFVIIFIIMALIPIFSLENFRPREELTFKKFIDFPRKHKGFFFATIVDNIRGEVGGIIWPIFVFLIIENLISVGWVSFLITAGTMLFTLFLGRHFDKKSKYLMMRLGSILYASVWILRGFLDSPVFIYVSSILTGFFGLMLSVPFTAIFYKKIDEERDSDSFIVLAEIPNFIGRAIIWIVAIALAGSFANFRIFFIVAGLSGLSFAFWKLGLKEDKKKSKPKEVRMLEN